MLYLRPKIILLICALLLLLSLSWWFPLLAMLTDLAALPARWPQASSLSILSPERDHFDITFASYDRNQSTAGSSYIDVVPPILHHINLGSKPPREEWMDARNHCIAHHPGWETFLWDDARAKTFVAAEFPHLKHMWDNYLFPVQRVDALRYMLLQKYGGEFESLSISLHRPPFRMAQR
jgi:mannosyltransferase OCH1-like enzyme